jgi:hypothetical protein
MSAYALTTIWSAYAKKAHSKHVYTIRNDLNVYHWSSLVFFS